MNFFVAAVAGVAGALTVFLVRALGRARGSAATAARPPATPADAATSSTPGTSAPWMTDSRVDRVLALGRAVSEGPPLTMPEQLLHCAPFVELVELMSDESFPIEALLAYAAGDLAIPAWAAMRAMSRRPATPELHARLLARLNLYNAWTREFLLRTLEAWAADDATLAGRVLLRLDDSWERTDFGVVLDDFLHRRAGLAPLSVDGLERPDAFDPAVLRGLLRSYVDPGLAAPLLDQLRDEPAASNSASSSSSSQPRPIGTVRDWGALHDDGLSDCATADAVRDQLLETLSSTHPRSALVVGEAGVGKSAVMRRVAVALARQGWTILEAGALEVNAGAKYVGELEARVQQLIRQLAKPKTLWLAADFHRLLYAGRYEGNPSGALDHLLPAIEGGQILVLGEIRPAALDRVLNERPDIARVFAVSRLAPPAASELDGLLAAWAAGARKRRGVGVPAPMLREAAALARQFLSSMMSPGGVLRLLDDSIAIAARRSTVELPAELTMDDLVASLARLTGMPLDILDDRRTLDLAELRERFESRVIGQPEAVRCLLERIALIKAGVTDAARPYGVFLFAGGSGTGKTELAKTCAELLFGSLDRLVRLDMSELQDPHAVDRVIGRGGRAAAGQSLVERVRRQPFAVVLLDEFEKAHPRVWDLFLQVFDDGRLSDHAGEVADFRHAIIILTSNLGTSDVAAEIKLGMVGEPGAFSPTTVGRAIERTFRPEFLNRLDRTLVFRPLTREVMRQIVRKELAEAFERRGLRRRDWAVELDESAVQLLVDLGFSPRYGARPLRRALERLLLTPIAQAIVDRKAPEGEQFLFVRRDGDRLAVEFVDPDGAPAAPRVSAAPFDGGLAAMMYDPRGTHAEVARLRDTLEALAGLVGADGWREAKQALLAEVSAPGFWERPDRHERLGRAEYLDRIENALRSAASLLRRLEGGRRAPREGYSRELERRLAQSLFLLDAASHEALDAGPRDAFVILEPLQESGDPGDGAASFATRLEGMYEAWARARGMRCVALPARGEGERSRRLLAVSGFAAYALLAAEEGVHTLDPEGADGAASRRPSVRVRVLTQPPAPAHGEETLVRQALDALRAAGAPAANVVRRYREGANPLVRDAVRRWRTGRADRVFAGDFDIIPVDGDAPRSADGAGGRA